MHIWKFQNKIQLILYLNITIVDFELIKMYANLNYEDKDYNLIHHKTFC